MEKVETVLRSQFEGGLLVRVDYEDTRTRCWTRDECLDWLFNIGCYSCGMSYCDHNSLIEEVLLQKAELNL